MFKAIIISILDIYSLILLLHIVLSFTGINNSNNTLVKYITEISNLTLRPVRKFIKPTLIGDMYLDFAPLIVLIIINLLQSYL